MVRKLGSVTDAFLLAMTKRRGTPRIPRGSWGAPAARRKHGQAPNLAVQGLCSQLLALQLLEQPLLKLLLLALLLLGLGAN